MVVDYTVHPSDENIILGLKKFMGGIFPLLDRLLNEPLCYNERVVIGKLACLGSMPDVNDRSVESDKSHSLKCPIHHLVHIDNTTVRTQHFFLGGKEGGWFIVNWLLSLVWAKVWGCVPDGFVELDVKRSYGLVYTQFVRGSLNISG
jgi:hypothetical protein